LNSAGKCKCSAACGYVVAVIGSMLIVGGLVWIMRVNTHPEPLGEDRAAVRRKALEDVRNADNDVLNNPNYVWQDQPKGIVRMPLKDAMDLYLRMEQDPAAARSNMLARVKKAFPPPMSFE
jgi:hypothetical protein